MRFSWLAGGAVFAVAAFAWAAGLADGQTQWVQRTPARNLLARTNHAMAYDVARQRVVLFGGGRTGDETWEWDGVQWTQRTPKVSPPPRKDHAMVYDTVRRRVVLFGGTGNSYLADTWEWDGTTWTQRQPTVSPPARTSHAMAYDQARQRVVLFGGNGGSAELMDHWEWDGTTWTQRNPAALPWKRGGHAMAYDAKRQRVVMFGGFSQQGGMSSPIIWEWDGVNWSFKNPQFNPQQRSDHVMAYDAGRQRVVLFGGHGLRRGAAARGPVRGQRIAGGERHLGVGRHGLDPADDDPPPAGRRRPGHGP